MVSPFIICIAELGRTKTDSEIASSGSSGKHKKHKSKDKKPDKVPYLKFNKLFLQNKKFWTEDKYLIKTYRVVLNEREHFVCYEALFGNPGSCIRAASHCSRVRVAGSWSKRPKVHHRGISRKVTEEHLFRYNQMSFWHIDDYDPPTGWS